MPICKICGKDSFWTVDLNSKLCKDCKTKKKIESQKIAEEKKKNMESQKIAEEKKNPSYVPPNQEKIEKQTPKDINNLSLKYSILKAFKGFLILSMIGSTYYTIDWFITYLDLPSMAQEALNSIIIYYIIGYISSIFSMFCLIKMVDFLFDLNSKIDN